MRCIYRFRDTNENYSVVSVWLDTVGAPIDYANALAMGALIQALSDAALVGMTLSFTEAVAPGVSAATSNANRLYLVTCFLVSGDTYLVIIPSADIQYLAVDAQGATLPVIDPSNPIMATVQAFVAGLTDEYGVAIERAVLVGLAE